ncbi:Uncharacterized protein dnm_038410 [Desulfonema magnum]|uniref:Uncharacterized protein n=1 Tax=Desulfonema magnum TaxID=45655 RepID=A0A975BMM1_9BACT|nr:Uncharacterized protein dnm_038410 [Desulfonema magnum]
MPLPEQQDCISSAITSGRNNPFALLFVPSMTNWRNGTE